MKWSKTTLKDAPASISDGVPADSKPKHLRFIHFTLFTLCLLIANLALVSEKTVLDKAIEQVKLLQLFADQWRPQWLEKDIQSTELIPAELVTQRQTDAIDKFEVQLKELSHLPIKIHGQNIEIQVPAVYGVFEVYSRVHPDNPPRVNAIVRKHAYQGYFKGRNWFNFSYYKPSTLSGWDQVWNEIQTQTAHKYYPVSHSPVFYTTPDEIYDPNAVWTPLPVEEVLATASEFTERKPDFINFLFAGVMSKMTGESWSTIVGSEYTHYYHNQKKDYGNFRIVLPVKVISQKIFVWRDRYLKEMSDNSIIPKGLFDEVFPELLEMTAGLENLAIEDIAVVLESWKARSGNTVEVFGIKTSAVRLIDIGAFVILLVQLYFTVHLLSVSKQELSAWRGVPWVALYSETLAKILFVVSGFLAPPFAVLITLYAAYTAGIGDLYLYKVLLGLIPLFSIYLSYKGLRYYLLWQDGSSEVEET